ncbi:MAG: cell division protein FtsA, partial [Campylobacterota bacterium]|nr:cell division protein FtsA [Campylobacterota bacterium]
MSNTLLAIDIGTINVTAVIAKNDYDTINILGTGTAPSEGINKGSIINIDKASGCIKAAADSAKRSFGQDVDSTVVSISGTYTRSIRSTGSINIPNGQITPNEIKLVLETALYNSTIVPDYEVIHVIPIFFKVDDANEVKNPLDMNGSRLDVSVYIVTAKKTALINIQSALNNANIEVNNFVLNGYASALSVLEEEQRNLGVAVIDLGGSTTEISLFKGNAIIYNDFLPIGSMNITKDLSIMLHTPMNAAEEVKTKYGTLYPLDADNANSIKRIKMPTIGDEQNQSEHSLDRIGLIIHARVEETLIMIKDMMHQSGVNETINAGIVLTGGMSKLPGIKKLASAIFGDIPIKVANPFNIKNGWMSFDDQSMSTIVGLIFYGLNKNTTFELDSNRKLRYYKQTPKAPKPQPIPQTPTKSEPINTTKGSQTQQVQKPRIDEDNGLGITLTKEDKSQGLSKFW